MSHVVHCRHGGSERAPDAERLQAVIDEWSRHDDEHPDACLTHESGWCISLFESGLMLWEDVEAVEHSARHLRTTDRKLMLKLWLLLADGKIAAIEAYPCLDGNG